jgi:hypothetical protein
VPEGCYDEQDGRYDGEEELFELDAEIKVMVLIQLEEVVLSHRERHLVD